MTYKPDDVVGHCDIITPTGTARIALLFSGLTPDIQTKLNMAADVAVWMDKVAELEKENAVLRKFANETIKEVKGK